MMITSEIQLFQILKQKLGEKEAEALVEFVESKLKENNETNLKVIATKEDISLVKEDLAHLEVKIIKWMVSLIIGLYVALTGTMIGIINIVMAHWK